MHDYFYNIKLSFNQLVVYREFLDRRNFGKTSEKSKENLKSGMVKGKLSKGSAKKIRSYINTWISTTYGYLLHEHGNTSYINDYFTFCTLTLSAKQMHSDKDIKRKMFDRFIVKIKRECNVETYLWVAETQKNDNLHFHILLDRRINYKLIRRIWNEIQSDNGYIEAYQKAQLRYHKDGFKLSKNKNDKRSYQQQYRAYKKGLTCNFTDPNSTDIVKIESMKNIASYIVKYMTKGHNGRLIEGRLWGCSDNLKEIDTYVTPLDDEIEMLLASLETNTKIEKYHMDFGSIYSKINYKEILNELDYHYKVMNEFYYYQFQNKLEN